MYLIQNVDKGLGVIPTEGTDHTAPVLARKDCLNQGGKLAGDKRASDQAFTSWRVDGEGPIGGQLTPRITLITAETWTYRSRPQRWH